MKWKVAGLIASIVLFGAFNAEAATYTVDILGGIPVTPIAVNGTIVTDGASVLNASDISGFNLTLTNGSFVRSLVGSTSDVSSAGSDLTATSTGLVFDFAASSPGYIKFFNSAGDYFCLQTSATTACTGASFDNFAAVFIFTIENAPTGSGAGLGQSGPLQFATENVAATPLPAALPLFASGVGAIGLLGWRRKKKAQAVAA